MMKHRLAVSVFVLSTAACAGLPFKIQGLNTAPTSPSAASPSAPAPVSRPKKDPFANPDAAQEDAYRLTLRPLAPKVDTLWAMNKDVTPTWNARHDKVALADPAPFAAAVEGCKVPASMKGRPSDRSAEATCDLINRREAILKGWLGRALGDQLAQFEKEDLAVVAALKTTGKVFEQALVAKRPGTRSGQLLKDAADILSLVPDQKASAEKHVVTVGPAFDDALLEAAARNKVSVSKGADALAEKQIKADLVDWYSDPTLAMAKPTVLKVFLTVKEYTITKNDLGVPLRRSRNSGALVKAANLPFCFEVTTWASEEYAGGGTFASANDSNHDQIVVPIKCK